MIRLTISAAADDHVLLRRLICACNLPLPGCRLPEICGGTSMKNCLLAAAMSAAVLASTSAHALITIDVIDNGVNVGSTVSTTNSAGITIVSDPAFDSISVNAIGAPYFRRGDLSSVTQAVSSASFTGTHTLTVNVIQTGVIVNNSQITFTVDNLIGDLGPTTESTFANIVILPPLGLLLDSATFPAGTKTSTVGPVAGVIFPSTDSDVNQTIVSFTGPDQSVNDTIEVATRVPELSTWALMLVGFAGLGFAGYRAQRKSTAAA
jgi:hypothetical protein